MTNKAAEIEVKLTSELTEDEVKFYSDNALAIAKKYGFTDVHPVVQINPDTLERNVCYLQEPNYLTKLALMDKAVQLGPYMAGEELRQICTIKEESDSITYGEGPQCDRYKMGVIDYCLTMVKRLQNQFKKK